MEFDRQTLAFALLVGGALLALPSISFFLYKLTIGRPKAAKPAVVRSADAGPPKGAVEWVADIKTAMGAAPAESVLSALARGASRDAALQQRIAELEGGK